MAPLKLALVTRRYPPLIGGAEKVLSYLAYALAAEGAEVTVLTSCVPGLDLPEAEVHTVGLSPSLGLQTRYNSGCLTIVRLGTSQLRFWGTWRYMRALQRWFSSNRIDLAYVSMLKHDAYSVIGAGERLHFPVVLRPEGAGATGDIAWQSWGNFGRLIGVRCRRATAFVAISRPIERELQRAWNTGTMQPLWLERGVKQIPAKPRIETISNGVPIPEVPWQQRANWRTAPRAIFVGRLAQEKGLDILISAWPAVRAVYADARLILLGEGPLKQVLRVCAQNLGMDVGPGETIEMRGPTANPTEILREADLFVLPSREEGMSIALLEAMALGIPLVASSIPGNRQLIGDFKHGRLVPPDDPAALSRTIIDQWADFDRAFHMGRAARNRVNQEFSIRKMAQEHLALFEEILGTGHKPDR
jgi:glycosyltransferase involved in cell wall biosynthesis